MSPIRLRLVAYAIAALVCQGAALSAAPLALCRGALSATDHECCTNLKPGQTCPMHRTTHGAERRAPGWACVCSPSEIVMASIVGVSGTLPMPIRVPDPAPPITVTAVASFRTLDQQEPPQYLPPRVASRPRSTGHTHISEESQ
jgi:hypothetical protein